MNTNLSEILVILDRSGSMGTITKPAIDSFNQFIATQAEAPGEVRLSLLLFDDEATLAFVSKPIAEVPQLDQTSYLPRGSTALLDAMATGIDDLGRRLAAMPEDERPGTVIVAILTDGMENASTMFTRQDVEQRISHQKEVYQWNFLYLGANQDSIAEAARIGIGADFAGNWLADARGIGASNRAMSRKMLAMRKQGSGSELSEAENRDLYTPLSFMVDSEMLDHELNDMIP